MSRHSLLIVASLVALALTAAAPASAQKILTGTIATNTTLNTVGGAVYQVTGSVTVNAAVTLTIDPGVTLKFSPSTY